jgi:hypothetical protein
MNNKQARQAPYERGTLLKSITPAHDSGLYLVTGRGIARVKHDAGRGTIRQEVYSFSARCYIHIYIDNVRPVDGSGPVWEVTP